MRIYLTNNKTDRMTTANKTKGYYDFPIGDGQTKRMHFSMNFVFILQDIVEQDLTKWLENLGNLDETRQGLALSQLVFAGFAAYDLEEDNEVDYTVYKIRDWLYNALQDDPKITEEVLGVMTKAFTDMGKKVPVK